MLRIIGLITVFITGFILGKINFDYTIIKIVDKISEYNITSITDIFTTREIASGIWIFIFITFFLLYSKVRDSVFNLIKAATAKQLIISFSIIIVYSISLVLIVSWFSFWEWRYLKDIIFWVIFVGVPISYGAITIKKERYFSSMFKMNFKFTIIVELLLNTITFGILTELIILSLLTFLILLEIVASTDSEYHSVKKLVSTILGILGFIILGITLKNAIDHYVVYSTTNLLIEILIPIVLSVLFIPIAYGFAVFSKYEKLFKDLKIREPKNEVIKKKYRWEIIKTCKLSYRRVTYFKKTYLNKIHVNISLDNFNQIIADLKADIAEKDKV